MKFNQTETQEQVNTAKRILVVVDVQKAYASHFTKEYVEALQSYIESSHWDQVLVRFIGEDEYSVMDLEGNTLHTFYSESRHIPSFLKEHATSFSERWFGYDLDGSDDVEEIVEDKLYKVIVEGNEWYMAETPNGDMYCPSREMEELLNEEAEIYIVGGFEDQCVKEVYDFLVLAGAENVQINSEYCFGTEPPNVARALEFTKDWVEPTPLPVESIG